MAAQLVDHHNKNKANSFDINNEDIERYHAHANSAPLYMGEKRQGKTIKKSLLKWTPIRFLEVRLIVLLRIIGDIGAKDKESQKKQTFMEAIQHEIWTAVNAIKIYRKIKSVFISHDASTGQKERDECINALVQLLTNDKLQSALSQGEELVIPCGLSNHAMYLTIYTCDGELVFRLDDRRFPEGDRVEIKTTYHQSGPQPGKSTTEGKPIIIGRIALQSLSTQSGLHDYLTSLFSIKFPENEKKSDEKTGLGHIYNVNNQYQLGDTTQPHHNDFPFAKAQTVDNCVMLNYDYGVKIRMTRANPDFSIKFTNKECRLLQHHYWPTIMHGDNFSKWLEKKEITYSKLYDLHKSDNNQIKKDLLLKHAKTTPTTPLAAFFEYQKSKYPNIDLFTNQNMSNCKSIDLSCEDLKRANYSHANFKEAKFVKANLEEVKFCGTKLQAADISEAINLKASQLGDAIYSFMYAEDEDNQLKIEKGLEIRKAKVKEKKASSSQGARTIGEVLQEYSKKPRYFSEVDPHFLNEMEEEINQILKTINENKKDENSRNFKRC